MLPSLAAGMGEAPRPVHPSSPSWAVNPLAFREPASYGKLVSNNKTGSRRSCMGEHERLENYKAGQAGLPQRYVGHSEDYQRGQLNQGFQPDAGRKTTDGGGGAGILGIFLIAGLVIFIAFVITALGAALITAPLLMLAVKLTGSRQSATFREAFNMMAGIVVISLILIAAVLAASVYFEWNKVGMSGIAAIDLGLRALSSLGLETEHMQRFSASFPGIRAPQFASQEALMASAFLAPLVLFSAIAMKSTLNQVFQGAFGFLRALAISPFILVAGLITGLGFAVAIVWLLDRWF
jgi:hypothetical protein